ncbi:MAG: glycosyltransferase family 4 protein [Actinomycetota bacterium]
MPETTDLPRTLVITNDFPPRVGGVQQYVHNLVANLPAEKITVIAPRWAGWREFDARQPFRVVRAPGRSMWPTRRLAAKVQDLAERADTEVVLFGHGFPLGALGPRLAERGTPYVLLTHGVEYWMALTPGLALGLRRAASRASRVTVISRFTGRTIRTAIPKEVPMSLCPPGVDVERFRPGVSGDEVRRRHRVGDRPLVVCVSRLVRRKGQDVLIRSMDRIRRRAPGACLLVVGDGPDRARLLDLARGAPAGAVSFAGAVTDQDLPTYYAAADVFAMPCHSRFGGLEVEGFGIVYLEAAASGKAVVAGRSGGAAEAVVDGETGLVVEGDRPDAVAEAVGGLLADPVTAADMGKAGRERAEREYGWPAIAGSMAKWLREAAGGLT